MNEVKTTDIIDKIDDLIHHATKYEADILRAARREILALRRDLKLERYWKRYDREHSA